MMRSLSSTIKHNLALSLIALIWWVAIIHPAAVAEQVSTTQSRLRGKKVALVIPFTRYSHFLHEELINAFDNNGVNTTIVLSQLGKVTPNHGAIPVTAEVTIDQVDMNTFDALLFAGGGALYTEFENDPNANELIQKAAQMDKVLAGLDLGKAVLVNASV